MPPSVHAVPSSTSFTASLPQVVVRINEEKALSQGVSIAEIYSTIAAQYASTYVNDFNKFFSD